MPKQTLAIIERAYRGAVEQQYAQVLWFAHALRKMRSEIDIVLRGNAVRYALQHQPQTQLTIGGIAVEFLPHYESAIRGLLADGVGVYVYQEDCRRLLVASYQLIPGVVEIDLAQLAHLCACSDCTWHW